MRVFAGTGPSVKKPNKALAIPDFLGRMRCAPQLPCDCRPRILPSAPRPIKPDSIVLYSLFHGQALAICNSG